MTQRNDHLFAIYYQMGLDRSLEKMADLTAALGLKNTTLNTLKRYSSDFGWQQRVLELDARQQEARNQDHMQAIQTMNDRQSNIGRAMQGLGAQGLRGLQANLLNVNEVVSLSREGARMERLAMGEATSRSEVATQVVNRVVIAIVELFNQVNDISDNDERRRQFALGADQIVQDKTVEVLKDVQQDKVVEV